LSDDILTMFFKFNSYFHSSLQTIWSGEQSASA